jgi:hypothetical protein
VRLFEASSPFLPKAVFFYFFLFTSTTAVLLHIIVKPISFTQEKKHKFTLYKEEAKVQGSFIGSITVREDGPLVKFHILLEKFWPLLGKVRPLCKVPPAAGNSSGSRWVKFRLPLCKVPSVAV